MPSSGMKKEKGAQQWAEGKLPMASRQPEQLHRYPVLACTLPCPKTEPSVSPSMIVKAYDSYGHWLGSDYHTSAINPGGGGSGGDPPPI